MISQMEMETQPVEADGSMVGHRDWGGLERNGKVWVEGAKFQLAGKNSGELLHNVATPVNYNVMCSW